jgi:hypothetical protein
MRKVVRRNKKHYMERSLGSAFELETHMLIVEKIGVVRQKEAEGDFKIN